MTILKMKSGAATAWLSLVPIVERAGKLGVAFTASELAAVCGALGIDMSHQRVRSTMRHAFVRGYERAEAAGWAVERGQATGKRFGSGTFGQFTYTFNHAT
jgi:hypothetical protein